MRFKDIFALNSHNIPRDGGLRLASHLFDKYKIIRIFQILPVLFIAKNALHFFLVPQLSVFRY